MKERKEIEETLDENKSEDDRDREDHEDRPSPISTHPTGYPTDMFYSFFERCREHCPHPPPEYPRRSDITDPERESENDRKEQ